MKHIFILKIETKYHHPPLRAVKQKELGIKSIPALPLFRFKNIGMDNS